MDTPRGNGLVETPSAGVLTRAFVLVVEDDANVSAMLETLLQEEGCSVRVADSLFKARGLLSRELPDLIVLDRRLPDGDGFQLCLNLRCQARTELTPILFLTSKKGVPDRVAGLEAGADDYLAKPFSIEEFVARTRALLRRRTAALHRAGTQTLKTGTMSLDQESRIAYLDGRPLALRAREFNLLACFLENPGRVLSRSMLLQCVWGLDKDLQLTTNVVDVTVGNLRAKLGQQALCIVSVRGFGFRFDPPEPTIWEGGESPSR